MLPPVADTDQHPAEVEDDELDVGWHVEEAAGTTAIVPSPL